MKTKFLYPVLCLLLWACGSDDDATVQPDQPEPEAACYVQEAVTTFEGITTTEKYTYNANQQLVKTEHYTGDQLERIIEHQYDGRGRLQQENLLSPTGKLKGAVRYQFNARNQVTDYTTYEVWLEENLVPKKSYTCAYDSTVLLRSTTAWSFANNKTVQQAKTDYTYKRGGIMHTATVTGKDKKVADKITLSFDNHHTPMFGLQRFLMTRNVTPGYPHAHNIITYQVLDADNKSKPASSYTSRYEYNDKQYPTKAIITYGDNKVKTIAYTYACP